jgi:choline dehydrogenase-like flavoprotein
MATSPERGVVDMDHQVFGLRGLHVVDGSSVPSSLGVNPQETIMALATRAAERIDVKLSAG